MSKSERSSNLNQMGWAHSSSATCKARSITEQPLVMEILPSSLAGMESMAPTARPRLDEDGQWLVVISSRA